MLPRLWPDFLKRVPNTSKKKFCKQTQHERERKQLWQFYDKIILRLRLHGSERKQVTELQQGLEGGGDEEEEERRRKRRGEKEEEMRKRRREGGRGEKRRGEGEHSL